MHNAYNFFWLVVTGSYKKSTGFIKPKTSSKRKKERKIKKKVGCNHSCYNLCDQYVFQTCLFSIYIRHLAGIFMPMHVFGSVLQWGERLLEPNTFECPIRTIRTYWAEILLFDQKMSCSAQYVRMAMTLKILQVLIILPRKIYNFTKDNSTHGNFVQGQLDQRQFRPNSIVSVSTRISWSSP